MCCSMELCACARAREGEENEEEIKSGKRDFVGEVST